MRPLELDAENLAPFRAALVAWLDQHGTDAVLVRPDRYVFGTGAPSVLLSAWTQALNPAAPALPASMAER